MDPERQPLLGPSTSNVQYRNRPIPRTLTAEEVKASGRQSSWRRTHLALVLVFWGTVAALISTIVCMVITTPPCGDLGPGPTVPPAHLTFAPLISRARLTNHVYAL